MDRDVSILIVQSSTANVPNRPSHTKIIAEKTQIQLTVRSVVRVKEFALDFLGHGDFTPLKSQLPRSCLNRRRI